MLPADDLLMTAIIRLSIDYGSLRRYLQVAPERPIFMTMLLIIHSNINIGFYFYGFKIKSGEE
jgi:hypothetical protein